MTRADWSPALYQRFADQRLQPIVDLLARVPLARPARIVDLGCGAGASTGPLAERYPDAAILGIDTSPAMLDAARAKLPAVEFALDDIGTWRPQRPVDLLFANAALQWVADHDALLPRLMDCLAPGGVLAVQVPDNLNEPSHRLMREVAIEPRFAGLLAAAAAARAPILSATRIYDLIAPAAAAVEIWRTTYYHPLSGPEAIVEMVRATGLKPYIDPLGPAEREAYLADYGQRVAAAYPAQADGKVLFRFPRLFYVAVKAG